jgi:hypothetical protein
MQRMNAATLSASHAHGPALGAEQFVWLIARLCRAHYLPFDGARLQPFRPPYDRQQVCAALRVFGFRFALASFAGKKIGELPVPLIAFQRPAATRTIAGAMSTPCLILKQHDERILYEEAGNETPQTRLLRHFEKFFEPEVVLVTHAGPTGLA